MHLLPCLHGTRPELGRYTLGNITFAAITKQPFRMFSILIGYHTNTLVYYQFLERLMIIIVTLVEWTLQTNYELDSQLNNKDSSLGGLILLAARLYDY